MEINVLIVDDSAVMRKIIGRSIRQAASDILKDIYEAGDGIEALAELDKHEVTMIFSDVNMPNMSGMEFLRALGDTPHKGKPVIMVTTEGVEKTVLEALSLGAVGFVRKPFEASQLEAVIRQALDRVKEQAAA
jgi:two-component system chemotaxis response regulator CheY